MSSLDAFFENIKLPSMSEVAHALIKTLNKDEATLQDVRNIIGTDPALCAKLLRLANSAYYGLPRGVGTLDHAIAMVGMSQVRVLALAACLDQSFATPPGLNRGEYWKNCIACAGYSQWMASCLAMDAQQAWLTGVMLRLGELLIGQVAPTSLLEIESMPHLPGLRWEREQRLVGFSEGQITAEMARRWNFPMQMVQALERSSRPLVEQAFSRLGAVVHLASLLADTPYSGPAMLDTLPLDVIDSLRTDMQWMQGSFPRPDCFIDLNAP